MTKDMTGGNPARLILGFAIPLLFGNLFQQFYNLMDTIIVGKFLGVSALAAVGSTGSINFLIIGFCMGMCSGFSIPVAQCFGAGDEEGMRKYVANAAVLAGIFALLITLSTVVFCRPILRVMRTPSDIIGDAYLYIVIIFIGIPATILYNMVSAILRSMGNSRTPLYFLILSAALNIILDLLCIVVLHMGVAGAALATVISQAVAGISCLIYMVRKFEMLRIRRQEWVVDLDYMKNLCSMGIPMGLQYSITAIGSVILQSAVNSLGSLYVASVTAANRIGGFFTCPFDALGATMATYAGQNIGAGKPERIRKGLKSANIIGAAYAVIAFIIMLLAGQYLALLFVDRMETAILENVRILLICASAFYFPLALVNNIRFLIQGMGYSKLAVLSGASEMLARGLAGFLLVPLWGFIAVGFASPLAWIMADIFLIPAYYIIMKKLEKFTLST